VASLREVTPAKRLLVKLAQRDEVRGPLDDDLSTLEDSASRARLVRLAMEHGIHGLAVSAVLRSPLMRRLSAEVIRDWQTTWHRLRRQAALWDLECDRVLSRLEGAGLVPLILKGGALRHTVYKEPAERSLGDLDLVVPLDQLEPAHAILMSLGYQSIGAAQMIEAYRRHHFHIGFRHQNGFIVELHWALSRRGSFDLDTQMVLSRAHTTQRANLPPLRLPSAEDILMHMATQNDEDAFGRLRRLVDLDRIVASTPELDWAYLREAAQRGGAQAFLGLSLRLAELLLNTPLPSGFIDGLRLSRLCRGNLALLRPAAWVLTEPEQRHEPAAHLLLIWTTVGWRRRLRRCRVAVQPHADPLAWLWLGQARSSGILILRALITIGAYQIWVYVRGVRALLSVTGRQGLALWRGAMVEKV
jgi:uncharacterized protein YciU (UPF0263 family)